MLGIQKLEHLCRPLETTPKRLARVLEHPERFIDELVLIDPAKPYKPRDVIDVRGPVRLFQNFLYHRVLLPKLAPSVCSHGGIRGRSIKTNALKHTSSSFVFKADISNFYPSVHRQRVYHLFSRRLSCSPDVARACTKLCTYKHHLALGLVTSPLLADQVLCPIDRRIDAACKQAGLIYTRFVDDITISGPYDLGKSGFARLVEHILNEHGFVANPEKHEYGNRNDGYCITGIRIRRGRVDVAKDYAVELERKLDDAASLSRADEFVGPYLTYNQLRGKTQFVCWVNPARRFRLRRKLSSINWSQHRQEAKRRGLVAAKPKLVKKKLSYYS